MRAGLVRRIARGVWRGLGKLLEWRVAGVVPGARRGVTDGRCVGGELANSGRPRHRTQGGQARLRLVPPMVAI